MKYSYALLCLNQSLIIVIILCFDSIEHIQVVRTHNASGRLTGFVPKWVTSPKSGLEWLAAWVTEFPFLLWGWDPESISWWEWVSSGTVYGGLDIIVGLDGCSSLCNKKSVTWLCDAWCMNATLTFQFSEIYIWFLNFYSRNSQQCQTKPTNHTPVSDGPLTFLKSNNNRYSKTSSPV